MKKTIKVVATILVLTVVLSVVFSLVACNKQEETQYRYFENDMLFTIKEESSGDDDPETEVVGFPYWLVSALFDEDETYFTFTSDGKVHGQLKTVPGAIGSLFDLASTFTDISGISEIDLDEAVIDPYVVEMFPGFTLSHLEASVALLKNSLGLSLSGIDYEHELVKEIESTHRIPADLVDRLPADFALGITFDQTYFLKTVTGEDGNTYEAIYVGDIVAHNENTQPFVIFSMSEKKGKKLLILDIEFIMFHLVLEEKL